MESWAYGDEIYHMNSMYLLPDDAWAYELTPAARNRDRMSLTVLVPDATPDDGPFTPQGSTHVRVVLEDGDLHGPCCHASCSRSPPLVTSSTTIRV